ncbi:MAG TPA: ATP-binding cassette domain-containing protein [Baekduia sp.]|nr:ATP-binding cassette domain-containing protein [Baekduia sp.]
MTDLQAPVTHDNAGGAGSVVMEARGLSRYYGSLAALQGVDLDVRRGEVVGLVGDNGAGKSTLLKLLCGAVRPSEGQIFVDGEAVDFQSPRESRERGIEVVYQDLALATELSIADNVFLGRERPRDSLLGKLRVLDKPGMARQAEETLKSLGIHIDDVRTRCGLLSGGQRQAVAVARAVMWGSKVLLLDEPTAALAVLEQRKIGALINEVKKQDVGVVLVSHNLRQVHELCDRVFVLLRGRMVATLRREESSPEELVRWITGVAVEDELAAQEEMSAELGTE